MGIRTMAKDREDALIEIEVNGHGCMDGIYNCSGRFDITCKIDGFCPDGDWYRIGDYTVNKLLSFKERGVILTYSDTCLDVKAMVEAIEKVGNIGTPDIDIDLD